MGPLNTSQASEKSIPCFRMFLLFFASSHSNVILARCNSFCNYTAKFATLRGETKTLPNPLYLLFRLLIHLDFIRPGARETLGRPLVRGVDPHLGAEIGQARGMLQLI